MAQRRPSSVEQIWKSIVDEVTKCVHDDSPNDSVLAQYLGRDIENTYRVSFIQYKNPASCEFQSHLIQHNRKYVIEIPSFDFRSTPHRSGCFNQNK